MHISESMPSRLERVDGFIDMLLARLSQLSLDQKVNFSIKLSLHEAIINAVRHGNKMKSTLSVQVDITLKPDRITIKVADQGRGFDYNKIPDPITEENLEKLNGRGIFLIQNTMDKVKFTNKGEA